jgi:hypothetical protein
MVRLLTSELMETMCNGKLDTVNKSDEYDNHNNKLMKAMCDEKTMSNCDFCEKQFTIKGISRHLKYCKIKAQGDRSSLIKKLLKEKNCELRKDSRLCNDYINNGEGEVTDIVNIMVEMKFYVNHTSYFEEMEEGINDMLEYKGRFDTDEESYCAKSRALDTWCEQYINFKDINFDILPETLNQKVHDIIHNRTKKEMLRIMKKASYGYE